MNHGSNDSNHLESREATEKKSERLKKGAENKERGEASIEMAKGSLNKNIQAETLERRLSRKSGATGYGVASADSLLPLTKKTPVRNLDLPAGVEPDTYIEAVKHLGERQKEQTPIAIIAQSLDSSMQSMSDAGGFDGSAQFEKKEKPDVIAQMQPDEAAVHEGVMTGLGRVHGLVNFATNALIGIGDAARMTGALERKILLPPAGKNDIDPAGTKMLNETCKGLALGSRVLLQYGTTLNEKSPFYGNDFDPEARHIAVTLSHTMPEKLKQEINQYNHADAEAKAAKSTELILDIYTCAEAGGMVITKAAQIAKETKLVSQISHDMQTFSKKLKELPPSEKLANMRAYLDRSMPKFGPELTADGPSLKLSTARHEAEEQALKMVKHSDRGKGYGSGGDKAREAKQLEKMRDSFQLQKLMQEGWKEKHEAQTVKYLRDKGETITKNAFEGTFSNDSPYARQTDAKEWELKSMSDATRSGKIHDRILAHARDGADKYTGKEYIGRVLIDAREQQWMTKVIAEQAMKDALKQTPKLREIPIVGEDFDIGLKRGERR